MTRGGRMALAAVAAALLAAGRGEAQQPVGWIAAMTEEWSRTEATLSGRVTDPAGVPIPGVRVWVRERTARPVTTGPDGRYTLELPADTVPGRPVTLAAERAGYSTGTRAITLGSGLQQFDLVLRPDPLGRDVALRVGIATGTPTRQLPYAASVVPAAAFNAVPATTLAAALEGRVAGLSVLRTTGEPGTPPAIRLRGAAAIGTSVAPLVLQDGAFTSGSLADLAVEDVARVEVLPGPAAAALFGADAGAGVLSLSTRRGREYPDGRFSFTVRNEIGASRARYHPLGTTATAFKVAGSDYVRDQDGRRVPEPDDIADNSAPASYEQDRLVLPGGTLFTTRLALEGRKGSRNLSASFQRTREDGVVFGQDGYRRSTLRLNVDQRLSSDLDLEVSTGYARSTDANPLEGVGGAFFGWRFLEPSVDIAASNPNGSAWRARIPDRLGNAANPLYRLENQDRMATRTRAQVGAGLRWRIDNAFAADLGWHLDRDHESDSDLTPVGFLNPLGNPGSGIYATGESTLRRITATGGLTLAGHFLGGTATTRLGASFEDRAATFVDVLADRPGPSGTEFTHNRLTTSGHTAAVMLATTLALAPTLTFDGVVRRESVALGSAARFTPTWWRVAGGWRFLHEAELRAAYGTAGLRSTYDPVVRQLGRTPAGLGLPEADEWEAGLHLGPRSGGWTLDYTMSQRRSRHLIGLVTLAGSTGDSLAARTIGSVRSTSHELALGIDLARRPGLDWLVTLTAGRSRSRLSDYLLPEGYAVFGFQPAAFRYAPGMTLGEMYGARAVRSIAALYDDPVKKALSGPGQLYDPQNFVVNEEGYVVSRAAWHTASERPITYVTCPPAANGAACTPTSLVRIGDSNPDFVAGFGSRMVMGRWSLDALVVWSQGGDVYNGTRQWPFAENRDPVFDQRRVAESARKPTAYYRAFFNNLSPHERFVEPGTWVKVRELSVAYSLERDRLRAMGVETIDRIKIGLVGRNLFTFTGYSGLDPEVGNRDGDPFTFRVDWFSYPHYRTISGVVEISF